MGDIAHIGLVDAHAEGHRGHHADIFLLEESILVGAAALGTEAGMVGQSRNALAAEPLGHVLDLGAAEAIDDA